MTKRLLHELRTMEKDKSEDIIAYALENNLFEWHFTMRGPEFSPFSKGFYHGKIVLPTNYPFEAPDVYFLTESGRFQTKTKICLTVTAYHPESWCPSYTIGMILGGVRAYMRVGDKGSIGSISLPKDKQKSLALKSHDFECTQCAQKIKSHIATLNERQRDAQSARSVSKRSRVADGMS